MNLIVKIRNLLGSLRLQELLKSINPFEDEQMKEYFFVMLKPFNMNNIIPKITGLLTSLVVIITAFSETYLGISGVFAIMLLILILSDLITGIVASIVLGEAVESKKGRRTIYKLGAYTLFIYVSYMLHKEMIGKASLFEEVLKYLHLFILIHITFWELFSVDENLKKAKLDLGITGFFKGTYNGILNIFNNKTNSNGQN